jgi:nitronate monooxygenase
MKARPLVIGRTAVIERSIVQAPIGSLATPELVAAVSNAGGLGSLALTWSDADVAARLVAAVRQRTRAPFIANFVLSFAPASLPAALAAGVPIVTFSWGMPGPLVNTVHSFGAAVGVQVGTLEGARRALQEGCDFLICQGVEAGGHVQSSLPLRRLLPAVAAEAGSVPAIAAGGLADGADVAAALTLGASGAMLGTRFVASAESDAHPAYKAALLSARGAATALTGCFEGGWPYALHRVLRNATLTGWEAAGCPPVGRRPGEGDIVARDESGSVVRRYDDAPPSARMQGEILGCCLYAGTGVARICELRSAEVLVTELWGDATDILRRHPDRCAQSD